MVTSMSESRNELVRAVAQLRKLAIQPSTGHDLGVAVVIARSALTKVQGEILSDAIRKGRANKGQLRAPPGSTPRSRAATGSTSSPMTRTG